MKNTMSLVLGATLLLAGSQQTALAEDISKIFEKVNELAAAENYPKAIEELGWAKKELEKKHFAKLENSLPAKIADFVGEKPTATSTMGFTSVERKYKKGSESIKLSIVGGSIGGAGGGAGGMAALGQLGAMMGNQPGTDTFRIDGRTANLRVKNTRGELSVFLKSGAVLKLEQRNVKDEGEALKNAAEAIQIGAIDSYLKGGSS